MTLQIYPAIDLRGGKCVRLRQGDYDQETVFGDDPLAMAERWHAEGAEVLHLVDLDGAKAGMPVNTEPIRRIAAALPIPCQCGGGIRDSESIQAMLQDVGVTRVIVGTQALKDPEWFRQAATMFPKRIVLGLDARGGMVATHGWLETSEQTVQDVAERFADLPLAAIVYTNIANDGMMQGIDDATLADLTRLGEIGLPIIASGGVTTLDDIRKLAEIHAKVANVVGVIVGRALYEGAITLPDAIATCRTVAGETS